MPYSQMLRHYQDPSYDNQQQWNETDYTNLQTGVGEFKTLGQPGFYDINTINANSQSVASPDYSQFLNFDASDGASFSVPSEGVASENFYNTSPDPTDISRISTNYPLKVEPGLLPLNSFPCGDFDGLPSNCNLQGCGPEPACIQMADLAEIEDCNAPLELSQTLESTEQNSSRRSPSKRVTSEYKARPKQTEERGKKSRNKRNHKTSESDDETANIRAKQAHSVVERRYRDNLNGKIMQLHSALAASGTTSRMTGLQTQDFYASREHRGKVRKSDVMTDAMNYVHQSEVEMRHMTDEITRLGDRVRALEKLVKCEDCTLLKQMVRLQLQQQNVQ